MTGLKFRRLTVGRQENEKMYGAYLPIRGATLRPDAEWRWADKMGEAHPPTRSTVSGRTRATTKSVGAQPP
jgi:hypothetical protein